MYKNTKNAVKLFDSPNKVDTYKVIRQGAKVEIISSESGYYKISNPIKGNTSPEFLYAEIKNICNISKDCNGCEDCLNFKDEEPGD